MGVNEISSVSKVGSFNSPHPLILRVLEHIVSRMESAMDSDWHTQFWESIRFSRLLEQISTLHEHIETGEKKWRPLEEEEIQLILHLIEDTEN